MGTTLPFQVKKASWIRTTSTSSSGNKMTDSLTLDANSKYLLILQLPVLTITGGSKQASFNLNHDTSSTIRLIPATRGVGTWYITTSSSSVMTYPRNYFSQSTTYSETDNAGFYAIKLANNGAPYLTDKQGVMLPLDVEVASWTASSSSAYNTKVTGSITFQGGHKYLVILNPPNWGSDTTPIIFGLSGNVGGTIRSVYSRGTTAWFVDRAGVTTDWESGIAIGTSTSYSYSSTSYGKVISIKIA